MWMHRKVLGLSKRVVNLESNPLPNERLSTEVYGIKREKTEEKRACRKLILILQKSAKISGDLREFTGECDPGILYSSFLFETVIQFTGLSRSPRCPVLAHYGYMALAQKTSVWREAVSLL